jgi:ribosomal protein L28
MFIVSCIAKIKKLVYNIPILNLNNTTMAEKICTICGKKSAMATVLVKLRGKYNPTAKQRRYPNLQWAKLPSGKRVLACAKCIKRISKI